MPNYAIDPEFLSYLERLSCGDRVIWHANLRWLNCFSSRFSGDIDDIIYGEWNGMFELAFLRHTEVRTLDTVMGIQFLCVDGQLYDSPGLLSKCAADGSLAALEVWKDAMRYLKQGIPHTKMKRGSSALAARFLRRERIIIPKSEMVRILGSIRRH